MKMKKLLTIASVALLLAGCGTKTYTVKGNLEGFNGSVSIVEVLSEEVVATTTTTDGVFQVSVESDAPMIAALVLNDKPTGPLFLDCDVVEVGGQPTFISIGGSPANDAYTKLIKENMAMVDSLRATGRASLEQVGELQMREKARNKRCYEENSNNLLGAFLVMSGSYRPENPQEILDAIESCPKDVQKSVAVKKLLAVTTAEVNSLVGRDYTNITLPNAEGKNVSLKSVVADNKVVLLDFWASWCRPCMMELRFLNEAYGKYHERGFEIYGVSLDEDKEKWVATVEDNHMYWPNVSDLKGWESKAVALYGFSGIPANFLIDSATGKIIAKDLRGEALDAALAEIFE